MAPIRTLTVDHSRSRRRRPPLRGKAQPALKRGGGGAAPARLTEIAEFGPNPGLLKMLTYVPKKLPAGSPLVVVLHGCGQDAEAYDHAAGWTALADRLGFAVLYPEQRKTNNPVGCFNWFRPADASRGLGETRSIRQMIDRLSEAHEIDPARIYVTGLSAGGAMTAALLADYPEVFAAGAIIAGLPCGAATSVQEVFSAMAEPTERTPEELGDLVRQGSSHPGPWPRVAILHGMADATVSPKNADELVKQWLNVHGAAPRKFREDVLDGQRRQIWSVRGRDVVELIMIKDFGHAAPLSVRLGEREGPFMVDAGLSSTRRIAEFFGLDGVRRKAAIPAPVPAPSPAPTVEAPLTVAGRMAQASRRNVIAATWRSTLSAYCAKALRALGFTA